MKIIYICRDYDIKKEIDSVRKISRIGSTCRFIYAAEKKFWLLIYLKTQPRTRAHISHVPSKYKNDSKQCYIYHRFSCDRCGRKAIVEQCELCLQHVCQGALCGISTHECDSGLRDVEVKLCNACVVFYCDFCGKSLCRNDAWRRCGVCPPDLRGKLCIECISRHEKEAHFDVPCSELERLSEAAGCWHNEEQSTR